MPMFNLGPALVAPSARRIYRIPLLGAALEVAPMTPANKAFWAERLMLVAAQNASGDAGSTIDAATVARGRLRDAEIMAKHVLVGWSGVTDLDGNAVPFSLEKARNFLVELATTEGAEHLFDDLRAFAQEDANFTNASVAAARALGGNSLGG